MKYPKYGDWCKDCVIKTIRKKKIHESKKYYEVSDILWIINGDPDNLSKSLFSAVQQTFAERYFQIAQEMNPQMDMRTIRRNGDRYLKLLYETLENITIDQLKGAVMYAFEHGTEEVEEFRISYVNTITENIAKVLRSSLADIEYVHINYLDPDVQRKDISIDSFTDYLMHLSQSGIFADTINWRYVDSFDNGKFLIEGDINHNNGYELNIVIAVKSTKDRSKVVEMLRESEE